MTTRPDLHHSQPVRVSDVLSELPPEERAAMEKLTAEERAEEERRASDKRVQDGTRDSWMRRLSLAIEKKLDEQNRLTRELATTLDSFRTNTPESRTIVTLREIRSDVEEMKNNSRLNERVLNTLCEIREINREIRDFIADGVHQGQQMQDLMLDAVRSMKESIEAIASVVIAKGTNGHLQEG